MADGRTERIPIIVSRDGKTPFAGKPRFVDLGEFEPVVLRRSPAIFVVRWRLDGDYYGLPYTLDFSPFAGLFEGDYSAVHWRPPQPVPHFGVWDSASDTYTPTQEWESPGLISCKSFPSLTSKPSSVVIIRHAPSVIPQPIDIISDSIADPDPNRKRRGKAPVSDDLIQN